MSDSNTSIASGLDAIFKVTETPQESQVINDTDTFVKNIAVTDLKPSPFQPRLNFDPISLKELAQSIEKNGIIQPIVARQVGNHYEIIAGERRWRAAQQVNLATVPIIIKNVSDDAAQAFALIENIQRKDLNIVEEAKAYKRLLNDLKLSHDEIANRVGKSRSHITNILRLLNLSDTIRGYLERDLVTMGHARALLSLDEHDREPMVQEIISKQLSVRETERRVQKVLSPFRPVATRKNSNFDAEQLLKWKHELQHLTSATVNIDVDDSGRSKLSFSTKSVEELNSLVEKIISNLNE